MEKFKKFSGKSSVWKEKALSGRLHLEEIPLRNSLASELE